MTRFSVACGVLLVLSGATASRAQPAAAQSPSAVTDGSVGRIYKSIDGTDLRLYVFDPPGRDRTKPVPAIVFFFGGAWTTGSVAQFVPQAKHFASRGIVAIVADYRVFSRQKTTAFEAIADGKSAIRWVRAHAAELGIDPQRIAAAGGSSGGHVALSAAVLDRFDEKNEDARVSSRPNALVLFNPAVDTSPPSAAGTGGRANQVIAERFGGRGRDGSPFHHLRGGLPPILVLHGTADATIPYADVERFCAEARKLGNRCEVIGYEGAGHGFFNPQRDEGKGYRETLLAADRFLTDLGYLRSGESEWQPLFDGKTLTNWEATKFGGEGAVRVADGQIVLEMGAADLTGITWTGPELPKTNYELSLQAMRLAGNDFFAGITFPVADSFCSLILGGWGGTAVGLSSINGEDASQNETSQTISFDDRRWYDVRIRVTPAKIQAWVDERQIIDLDTTRKRIGTRAEVEPSQPLGVAAWRTKSALRNIRLRRLGVR